MAKRKSDAKSKYFSPVSVGSKRKAEDVSPAGCTPIRLSTRVKKTVLPKEKFQESESEDESAETEYHEETEIEEDEGGASDDSEDLHIKAVPLPKPRTPGATPYEDDRIHPNTFLFLADLNANNNREWLKWHDKDFRNSQKDFETFVEKLSELVMEKDETIPELPKKDLIFRIYRDVRFSKDHTPYKPHFSVAWSRTGKKGPYAAYYVQIKPGGHSFVGGGLWQPETDSLRALREDINDHPHRLKRALMNENLRRTFFPGAKANEKKVVAAFVTGTSENALKSKPKVALSYVVLDVANFLNKGFEADHKDIALLRLRSFTMGKKIPDKDILSKDGIQHIADTIGALVPWITYLNRTVMPDRNQADTEEEDEDGSGDEPE